MSRWPFTESLRTAGPWGLAPDWLEPAKIITDALHGDINLTELERRILDSEGLQRLRFVRQLGFTDRVFPSATHNRLNHSLGTLHTADMLMTAVVENLNGPHTPGGLLAEWQNDGTYEERISEALVLARLGGLLHDICHIPFGHTIEDDFGILTPHDRNLERFERVWTRIDPSVRDAIENGRPSYLQANRYDSLMEELQALVLSKMDRFRNVSMSAYPFVSDIVGNTICADLLDYVQRDHRNTGMPVALGTRFTTALYVRGSDDPLFGERLVVQLTRDGRRRQDFVSELLKVLRYRYEETERILFHHAKVAADAMVGKLLDMWIDSVWLDEATAMFPDLAESPDRLSADVIREAYLELVERHSHGSQSFPSAEELDARSRASLDEMMESWCDCGLLIHISQYAESRAHRLAHPRASAIEDERWLGISELAHDVTFRRLYKRIGFAAEPAKAGRLHERFGSAKERRRLEREACRVAGIDPAWRLVLWIPRPEMRLKVAEVLVDEDGSVDELGKTNPDARRLLENHQELWTLWIYAHPDESKSDLKRRAALGYLKAELKLDIRDLEGNPVLELDDLCGELIGEHLRLNSAERSHLVAAAAMGGSGTFAERLRNTWEVAVKADLTQGEAFPSQFSDL